MLKRVGTSPIGSALFASDGVGAVDWYVNAPGAGGSAYPTLSRARRVAKLVQGSRIGFWVMGRHRRSGSGGISTLGVVVLVIVVLLVGVILCG